MGKNKYENSVDVLSVQEMRWIGTGIVDKGKNVILHSGHQTKHEFGVGFRVNNRIKNAIIGLTPINNRLCITRRAGRFFNYSIINAHAPVENAGDEKKKMIFMRHLTKAFKECPGHGMKVLAGDVDAQVGRDSICKPNIGRWSL
jgi:hypothetical protein